MRRELLIAAAPGEWRAAWLEDGVAVELHVERGDTRPAGSIHLGRVVRHVAGLAAALVEIGDERPGFLPRGSASGTATLDEGARVVVQVRREAHGDKGALLTTRIDPPAEPSRLAEQAAPLDPPQQLAPLPGFAGALMLRLPGKPDVVFVDDAAVLGELRAVFPDADSAHRAAADWPVDLGALFEAALSPTLALAGDGSIHIEESRAAVLIDVDTGSPESGSAERSIAAANIAAVEAIARQLRLRQLGGGIVIDFAALDGRRARERVRRAMIAALAADPAIPQVLGWTRLGHLEMVRPRRGRPLSAAMLEPQTVGKSAAALAFEALRALYREARARPSANWRLVVSPAVAAALRGPAAAALRALETRLGRRIAVAVKPTGDAAAFDIAPI